MTKRLTLPEWNELNNLLNYKDGELIWKDTKETACRTNASQPYKYIIINKRRYLSHRLIFKLIHKKEPGTYIDHINQNKLDNRIENLREVTCAENAANTNIPRRTILIDAQIPLIRELINIGYCCSELAEMFYVTSGAIEGIRYGNSWRHV